MFLLTLFSGFLPGLATAADELTDSLKFNGGVLMSLELSCRIQMSLSIDLDFRPNCQRQQRPSTDNYQPSDPNNDVNSASRQAPA
jgi:hypothetical protein